MHLKIIPVVLVSLFISLQTLAHGEDKLGPHGGYIRMPGTFHTELVSLDDQKFKIYLLDVSWQNPTIRDSSVKGTVKTKSEKVKLNCKAEKEYFLCMMPNNKSLKEANKIILKVVREAITGIEVVYDLPLKLETH